MDRWARLIYEVDGIVKSRTSKYNGKYLLENLLVCNNCEASYRRRTERGKVVWRCATRIEKGKEACADSLTLNEEWIQKNLGEMVCEDDVYNEDMIRNNVGKILIFNEYLEIYCKNEGKISIKFSI